MEAVQDEYITRHLPDGRIIYSDHRISFVAGYMTEEVIGMSAFNFIHQDDLPWATVANRQSRMFYSLKTLYVIIWMVWLMLVFIECAQCLVALKGRVLLS